ncbi:MaoC family dehydratase N-terminal domain-containing protein [Cryptosporangium sp. NPDC048952]|uniref:FAS1-like dehydratase domain-containing protein n=1 Tax=Cryptosporangium sp. NPDC048952 TaxID=3363961 RepID=UPI0037103CB3
MPTNVSDAMRGALGNLLTRRISYPVSASDIRKWALAVYWPEKPPREFLDADRAPEDFNPFAWAVAGAESTGRTSGGTNAADRTEQLAGIPGPGLQFQLNGGLETEYGAPIRPGDVITSENRLDAYSEREGKLGLMLFTVTEDTWTNQDSTVVKRSRMTLIRY